MGRIFLLMGKTYSYKGYIWEHCSKNPKLRCCSKYDIDTSQINVVKGNMQDYHELYQTYEKLVFPVYIDTPDEQVLTTGIADVKSRNASYSRMCQDFVEESDSYDSGTLSAIDAFRIKTTNECDACYEFVTYLKRVNGEID